MQPDLTWWTNSTLFQQRCPPACTSLSWLEDSMTKLIVADEVSAHISSLDEQCTSSCTLESPSRLPTTFCMTELGSYLPRKRTAKRCDHCESPVCMSQISGLSQSSSTRTSSRPASRTCSTASLSQDCHPEYQVQAQAQAQACDRDRQASLSNFS